MTDPHPLTARGVGPTVGGYTYQVIYIDNVGYFVPVPEEAWDETAREVLDKRHALWEAMATTSDQAPASAASSRTT